MTACYKNMVWKCRKVSNIDWCMKYHPGSKLGWMAWELQAGQPKTIEAEEEPEYQEPEEKKIPKEFTAYDKMVGLFNYTNVTKGYEELHHEIYVVKLPMRQYWDFFWADGAPYFIDRFFKDMDPKKNKI